MAESILYPFIGSYSGGVPRKLSVVPGFGRRVYRALCVHRFFVNGTGLGAQACTVW